MAIAKTRSVLEYGRVRHRSACGKLQCLKMRKKCLLSTTARPPRTTVTVVTWWRAKASPRGRGRREWNFQRGYYAVERGEILRCRHTHARNGISPKVQGARVRRSGGSAGRWNGRRSAGKAGRPFRARLARGPGGRTGALALRVGRLAAGGRRAVP